MTPFLETPRLLLRRFTEDDAGLLLALDSDPEVVRYAGPKLADYEAYRERIRASFLDYYARFEDRGFWAALEKESGDFLGWFHLRPGLDYRFAAEAGYRPGDHDLGYRLRRPAWGKGYATEMARALVRLGFADAATLRVVSCALAANLASTRVMEKAGLKRGAEFALPGYGMAVSYALERADFLGP